MEEENKLPIKRVELSLTKFNEVAIPHHLDLLRQHKANIIKYEEVGELARARTEQRHARRVAAQLRALLLEMDALRRQVRAEDRARFDVLTQRSRDTTLRAIVDYLGTSPLSINRRVEPSGSVAASAVSTDSVGVVAHALPLDAQDQIQLSIDDQDLALSEREELLCGWSELQSEVRALHDVWQSAQAAALAQRPLVAQSEQSVGEAADNVSAARQHLATAERLRGGALLGGACAGALVGGPLGLLVGAKAGALAAAAGSLIGYVGVRFMGRNAPAPDESKPPSPPTPQSSPSERKDKDQ